MIEYKTLDQYLTSVEVKPISEEMKLKSTYYLFSILDIHGKSARKSAF